MNSISLYKFNKSWRTPPPGCNYYSFFEEKQNKKQTRSIKNQTNTETNKSQEITTQENKGLSKTNPLKTR